MYSLSEGTDYPKSVQDGKLDLQRTTQTILSLPIPCCTPHTLYTHLVPEYTCTVRRHSAVGRSRLWSDTLPDTQHPIVCSPILYRECTLVAWDETVCTVSAA